MGLLRAIRKVRLLAFRGRQARIVRRLGRAAKPRLQLHDPRGQRRDLRVLRQDHGDQVFLAQSEEGFAIHRYGESDPRYRAKQNLRADTRCRTSDNQRGEVSNYLHRAKRLRLDPQSPELPSSVGIVKFDKHASTVVVWFTPRSVRTRGGWVCRDSVSALISGSSAVGFRYVPLPGYHSGRATPSLRDTPAMAAKVMLPRGAAGRQSKRDPESARQGSNAAAGDCRSPDTVRARHAPRQRYRRPASRPPRI